MDRYTGAWTIGLVGWTIGLVIWSEVVAWRDRNVRHLVEQEVRRRMPRRRPRPRPQSNVVVHPTMRDNMLGDQVEAWLRERTDRRG